MLCPLVDLTLANLSEGAAGPLARWPHHGAVVIGISVSEPSTAPHFSRIGLRGVCMRVSVCVCLPILVDRPQSKQSAHILMVY